MAKAQRAAIPGNPGRVGQASPILPPDLPPDWFTENDLKDPLFRERLSDGPPHLRVSAVLKRFFNDRIRCGSISEGTRALVLRVWKQLDEDSARNGSRSSRTHASGPAARVAMRELRFELDGAVGLHPLPRGRTGKPRDLQRRKEREMDRGWREHLTSCIELLLEAEARVRARGVTLRNPERFNLRLRQVLAAAFPHGQGLYLGRERGGAFAPIYRERFEAADQILQYSHLARRLKTPRAVRAHFGTDDRTSRQRRARKRTPETHT